MHKQNSQSHEPKMSSGTDGDDTQENIYIAMRQTWIIYKADDPDAAGWEDRQLLPSGSLTSILSEEWHYSGTPEIPKPGDRVREYANLKDPDNGVTHGRDGEWKIVRVCQFASFDSDERIVVCYCQYQPIDAQWEELQRGVPVDEMRETSHQTA